MTTATTSRRLSTPRRAPALSSPEPEKEEVVIEPDLPVEPEESPQDAARAEYDRLVSAMPPDEPVYLAGNRAPRLKVGRYVLQPGDIVPGAHGWPRRETYERLGRIERR